MTRELGATRWLALAPLLLPGSRPAAQDAARAQAKPERVGRIATPESRDEAAVPREFSGLARSSVLGVFWVHNDGGDRARLFAVRETGELAGPAQGLDVSQATNTDWEDLAASEGLLFVADVGNNGNDRRDLGLWVIEDPSPEADGLRASRFLALRYPDQTSFPAEDWRFDCEAVFACDGDLWFLTKHRRAGELLGFTGGTRLYRLDLAAALAAPEGEEQVLEARGGREDLSLVTAADLSPSGDRLAVLTYTALWIFDRPAREVTGSAPSDWLAGDARRVPLSPFETGIAEAIAWRDDASLLIANEAGELFRLDLPPR